MIMTTPFKPSYLESRTTRKALPPRPKPYFRKLAPGIFLGYRRNANDVGSWTLRKLNPEWTHYLGNADDDEDANDRDILDFWQAERKARETARGEPDRNTKPLTVSQALDDYA